MSGVIWFVLGVILLGVISGLMQPTKKGRKKRARNKKATHSNTSFQRSSKVLRSDDIILKSALDQLNGAEFERLLALYFRDQKYEVREVGVRGNDGGVDLVIIDQRGEKTAVQAKCYAENNMVPVMTVRELVGAKRNHDCILSLIVTTSDLTTPAKKEAEQFNVDYWHGGLVEQKLLRWGKWQPSKKRASNKKLKVMQEIDGGRTRIAASIEKMKCACGAEMVRRKNKRGVSFWGCTSYPNCRKTKSV